jgi:hypothetical protein
MQWFLDLCVQPGGYWVPVLIIVLMLCATLVAMVAVAEQGKFRRAKLHADLTQAMLARARSEADLNQVLDLPPRDVDRPTQAQ